MDNWDEDVVDFGQSNLNKLQASGENFELRHIISSKVQVSQLYGHTRL